MDIVSEYGAVIEQTHGRLNGIVSAEILPYSKQQIKAALIQAAYLLKDDPKQLEVLRSGYVALADFQPNAPLPKKKSPSLEEGMAMNEAEFLAFMNEQKVQRPVDLNEGKKALAEAKQLLSEWQRYMASLGVSNA
jgi:hypothetical protein